MIAVRVNGVDREVTYPASVPWLRRLVRAAERGDAEAQWHLGAQFDGDGFFRANAREWFAWHLRAAKNGAVGGWSTVAYAHERGIVVRKNPKRAFEIVLQSACAGDLASVMNLGRYYRDGIGVRRDGRHGILLLEEAVRRGFDHAGWELDESYRDGIGVRADGARAAYWQRLAERGEARSLRQMERHPWD